MPNTSSGSFDMEFKTEKSYTAFGKEYARCYANVGARARFNRPVPKGERGYTVAFEADCGCDTLIGRFNQAYKKTFDGPAGPDLAQELVFVGESAPQIVEPDDYTITLTSCSVGTLSNFRPAAPMLFASNAALLNPVNAVDATAIDSQMNYSDPNLPKALRDAVSNTTLYAQAAARAKLGPKVTKNSDYLKSKQWFDEVIGQMTDLGFLAHSASGGEVKQNTYSGEINLKDIVSELLKAYIGAAELEQFEAIANLIASDPDQTGVSNFLDFWWSAASYHTNQSNVAWGPVTNQQGSPSVTCVYFNIDVAFQDWRSLFISFHHEAVTVASSAITLNLDMDIYGRVEKQITDALTGEISKHIKHTKLDFND